MRRTSLKEKIVALGTSMLCALSLGLSPAVALAEVNVTRLAGPDRYATMSAILDEAAKGGKLPNLNSAMVVTGENYPDALAATSLVSFAGPIVLTKSNTLSNEAKTQLQKLNAKSAYAIGGPSAISADVIKQIEQMGIKATQIGGKNRQITSSAIALFTIMCDGSPSDSVILATGKNFADALSIGPWAYATQTPLLLVANNGLLDEAGLSHFKSNTHIRRVIMLGGEGVVSDGVKEQLGNGYTYTRIAGADRYETSAKIAEFEAQNGFGWSAPAIATGTGFADALSGATLCGANKSPILLVKDASGPSVDILKKHAAEVSKLYVLGGESAVSAAVTNGIASVMGGSAGTAAANATTADGAVTALGTSDFDSAIAKSDKLVVVDFWADWCVPCKQFRPVVEEVAKEMRDKLEVHTVDIEEAPSIADRYKINSIPCLMLFKGGKEVGRLVGARDKASLVSELNKYL